MTQYASYNEITATPEKHLSFLREINAYVAQGLDGRSLFEKLQKNVMVDGKPFSQAFHINKLESNSGNWDFDDVPDSIKVEMHQLSEAVKVADTGFDIPFFTIGYDCMVEDMKERGVDISTPVHRAPGGMDLSKAGSTDLETSSDELAQIFSSDPAKKSSLEQTLAR
jgi:hypothetical protein